MYYIYKYVSPSGKIYIGQTKRTKADRSGGKFGSCYRNSTYFYNAILKYGIDNFSYEIIEENLTKEEANEREKYYIKFYNSNNPEYGYNLTSGGEGHSLFDYDYIY